MKTSSATWDANCSVRFSTQDSGGLKMFCTTVHMKCSDAFRFRHSRQDQKLDASKTIPLSRKGHWRSNPKIARLDKVKKSTILFPIQFPSLGKAIDGAISSFRMILPFKFYEKSILVRLSKIVISTYIFMLFITLVFPTRVSLMHQKISSSLQPILM